MGQQAPGMICAVVPSGQVKLTDWIAEHGDTLGRRYANEIDRHYR